MCHDETKSQDNTRRNSQYFTRQVQDQNLSSGKCPYDPGVK